MTAFEARAVFMIGVAAELAGMHPQTLRMYERRGLLSPTRSKGGTRLYSQRDVARLRLIQEMSEAGLNLAGIERVLELERALEQARDRVRALEAQMLSQAAEAEAALDAMRRSLSTEIVLQRRASVPAAVITPIIRRNQSRAR
jgi:MerR family transcriptional regulator/heat shock protein HspR